MFPLGHPLVPHAGVPLHVFEERYRALMRDCLEGDRLFGVVMIERGSEVGGGEVRTGIGTLARIVEAEELQDGRWVLIAVGVRRLRVVEWLPDDPYPRATVEELEDEDGMPGDGFRDELVRSVRRISALRSELGDPSAPLDLELADDTMAAGYQAAAAVGLGSMDLQRLLEIDGPADRLDAIATALDDLEELLRMRIAGG